jgi:hypothetical protein
MDLSIRCPSLRLTQSQYLSRREITQRKLLHRILTGKARLARLEKDAARHLSSLQPRVRSLRGTLAGMCIDRLQAIDLDISQASRNDKPRARPTR